MILVSLKATPLVGLSLLNFQLGFLSIVVFFLLTLFPLIIPYHSSIYDFWLPLRYIQAFFWNMLMITKLIECLFVFLSFNHYTTTSSYAGQFSLILYKTQHRLNCPLFTVMKIVQHLHMEYISLSWSDIPELAVPIKISLMKGVDSGARKV
jgi:hypothetical protein